MQNVPKDEAVCEGKRWEGRWCQDVVVVGCKAVNAGVLDSSSPPWVGGGAGRDKSQVSTDD